MSNKIKIMLILLTALIVAIACLVVIFSKSGTIVLEYKDISDFDTKEISTINNNRKYLLVSGECNHSSLNIGEIKENLENRDMVIKVYTTLSRANNKDGSFMYAVKVDNNIERILFGNEKKVIWERNK